MDNDPVREKTHRREETTHKRENSSHKRDDPSLKSKINKTIDNLKKNEKIEDIYRYAKRNTGDTVAYIAMILGLLILFFEPFYGGIIVGFVTGLYFSKEIMIPIRNIEGFIEKLGMVRSLILGGLLLGLFIKAPTIFLGCAIAVAIKQLTSSNMPSGKK